MGIHADAISYFSIVAAAVAALCFWQSRPHPTLLIVAPLFCYLRLWCNMLDGMVALAAGQASRRGEIVNDLPDRVSDVLIFVGAAHSGWMHWFFGYWAAILSLGTAYIGTLGQAVGVQREFGGIMSKPWRMVALHLGAWLTYALFRWNGGDATIGNLSVLDLSCLVVIAGCLQTSAERLGRILRALKEKKFLMAPSTALHDPVFRAYVGIVLSLLLGAGMVLAVLQFVFRVQLGGVWRTYRSWLWMAPLVALAIFAGRVPFTIGVTAVSLLAFREFARISGLARDRWMSGAVCLGIIAVGVAALLDVGLAFAAVSTFLLLALPPILRNRRGFVAGGGNPSRSEAPTPAAVTAPGYNSELWRMSLGVVAFVLLGWMFGQLGFFASSPNAYGYLCYLIFATEVTDVSAFAFGKMFGRHLLRSEISPRKTWEGALGGLAVALALPWLLRFSFSFFGTGQLILAGVIVGVGGPLGDLSLSVIKRDLGAKDWGAAIPGHGGVLDRIDSLVFVVPLFMQMTEYYYPGR